MLRADTTGFTSGLVHHAQSAQAHARFGSALTTGDFDNDGNTDLVIGASNLGGPTAITTGGLASYQGTASGLSGVSTLLWPSTHH